MKIGLFFDLRNPPPWRRPWDHVYRHTLERIERAEQLGIDAVWFSEHHGFDDGYQPQPLVVAAAVAARTARVRIGTAIVVAPFRHPRHLAEEAAVVDLVSGGRLELGLGAGYSAAEYDAFGADFADRYRTTDATMAEVQRLLASRTLTPPAHQQPVPLWLGYQGPRGAARAGRLGVGLLSLDRARLDPYRAGLHAGGHPAGTARMGGVVNLVLADDPPAARLRILPHYAYQSNTYRAAHGSHERVEDTEAELRAALDATGELPGLAVTEPKGAIAAVRDRVAGLPVAHVYFWASIAGMPDDLVDRNIELLATAVAPELRAGASTVPGGPHEH